MTLVDTNTKCTRNIAIISIFILINCINVKSLFAIQSLQDCDSAINYQERALDLLNQEKYEDAIVQLNCAINIKPQEPKNYVSRASAYVEVLQLDKALDDLNKVIELIDNKTTIGIVVQNWKGGIYFLLMDYDRSIENYTRAIESWTEATDTAILAEVYIGRGEAHFANHEYELAHIDYNSAIKANPQNAVAFADRGFLYQELGMLEMAKQDWSLATKLDEQVPNNFGRVAGQYYRLGRYEQAKLYYDRVIQLRQPDYAPDYLLRGFVYYALGDFDLAIADTTRALEIDPNGWESFYLRGRSYMEVNKYQEAIEDFTASIDQYPKYPELYLYRAESFYDLQNSKAALSDYKKYLQLMERAGEEPLSNAVKRIEELESNIP